MSVRLRLVPPINMNEDLLRSLVFPDESSLTINELRTKRRCATQGISYYGRARYSEESSIYYTAFDGVMIRTKAEKLDSDYSRTPESFIEFYLEIGNIPDGMISPTVGRLDHSLGYLRGNFEWQSFSDNSSEVAN